MGRTYIPGMVSDIHQLAEYLVRYDSVIRAAIILAAPEALTAYETAKTAIIALDELRESLAPSGN